jgi:two-component system OmpR family sensor kinase
MRPLSLRARLLSGIVVLVAAGLAASSIIVYAEQRAFLMHRVDQQVGAAIGPLSFGLGLLGQVRPGGGGRRGDASIPGRPRPPGLLGPRGRRIEILPAGTVGELFGPTGRLLRSRAVSLGQAADSLPRLPRHRVLSRLPGPLHVVELSAPDGAKFRGIALRAGADTALIAVPLREAEATLTRLVEIELLVGALVLVAVAGLGGLIIGLGLRPLHRMAAVASEIAAGDLSRRVSPADDRTEVGRLGRDLNRMLAQIEEAFGARRASEARMRRFVADASHELRTPLAAIRGYAELIGMGAAAAPEVRERAIARIGQEAERMGQLVEALLALAAADEARETSRHPVSLRELLADAAAETRAAAPDRAVEVEVAGEPVVGADPAQLAVLVDNLTRNALLHTPPGTAVALRAAREDGWAVLAVRDHGPGLPPGAGEQLFERFWRPEPGRHRGAAGSGLGLAIVRAIAQAHGGEVTAADAPGGGALFTVRLPVLALSGKSQDSHRDLLSAAATVPPMSVRRSDETPA